MPKLWTDFYTLVWAVKLIYNARTVHRNFLTRFGWHFQKFWICRDKIALSQNKYSNACFHKKLPSKIILHKMHFILLRILIHLNEKRWCYVTKNWFEPILTILNIELINAKTEKLIGILVWIFCVYITTFNPYTFHYSYHQHPYATKVLLWQRLYN